MKYLLTFLTAIFIFSLALSTKTHAADCSGSTGTFESTCTADEIKNICNTTTPPTGKVKFACDTAVTINPINGQLPTFATLVEFIIKGVFLIGGIFALVQLVRGALDYIQSGGDAKKTEAAQARIRDAVVGVILLVIVFAIAAFLETFLNIGLGITKPLIIPTLIQPK